MVAMRREDGTYATPQVKKPAKAQGAAQPNWMWPVAVTVVSLAAIGVGGFLYFTKLETSAPKAVASNSTASPAPSTVAAPPSTSAPTATAASPAPAASPALAAKAAVPAPSASPPMAVSSEKFAAAGIPFISDKVRAALASDYAPAADFKAFSLNISGSNAFVTAQPSEEAAKSAAVEQCQKRADAVQSPRKCELYAVGDSVVYAPGRPPMPPLPWVRHDAATEQPFAARTVPLTRDGGKARLEAVYAPARKNKALALGPRGRTFLSHCAG
jgi:adenylate cyclase